MKIRIEISSLATTSPSGVGYYTGRLAEALDRVSETTVYASYFNFLNRQVTPEISLQSPLDANSLFPLRVYAKMQSYNLAPPFDALKPAVDLTIFPNFATWPCAKSKLRATTVHDLTYLYYPELVETKNLAHLKRVVPRTMKEADFIITVSESVKSELVAKFGVEPEKIVTTPIPPGEIFFKRSDNEIHKKYSIPTQKYIYFIGNLEPRKDLPTLIAAYRKLPIDIKAEYSLVMAGGNGWKTEASRAAIKDAKSAGENIIHIGYIDQDDSPALYQNASLFVMPSLYEGFGMPMLEAMASHTPVIASDIPVLNETGEDAAIYAKAGDPNDFCEKIQKVLQDQKLCSALNQKADNRLRKLSWQNNAEKIVQHAQNLL